MSERNIYKATKCVGFLNGRAILHVDGFDQEVMTKRVKSVDVENSIIYTSSSMYIFVDPECILTEDLMAICEDVCEGQDCLRFIKNKNLTIDKEIQSRFR